MSAPALTLAAVLAVPVAALASPAALTASEVRELVTRPDCGGVDAGTPEGVALRERLVAKFRRESGVRGTDLVHPFALRDETLGAAVTPVPATYEDAVAEAMRRLARGHVIGAGLGQITGSDNLRRDFGVSDVAAAVRLAFRPCAAVRAAVRHYAADIAAVGRVLDCASAAYNAGPGRVCENTPYVRAVRALQAALPAAVETPSGSTPSLSRSVAAGAIGGVDRGDAGSDSAEADPDEPPAWDAWAHDEWERARSETAASHGGARPPLGTEPGGEAPLSPDPSAPGSRPVVEPDPKTRAASAGGLTAEGGGPSRSPLTVREVALDEKDLQP